MGHRGVYVSLRWAHRLGMHRTATAACALGTCGQEAPPGIVVSGGVSSGGSRLLTLGRRP